jgi:hypothetical protein
LDLERIGGLLQIFLREDGKPNRQRLTRENSRVGHNPRTSTATTQTGIRRLHHPRVERNGSGENSGIHDYSNIDKKIQIDDDTMMVIDTPQHCRNHTIF